MNDIEIIYDRVKARHCGLVLTNSGLLDEGYSWDVPIICGESDAGRFHLYADRNTPEPCDEMFVFTVFYRDPEDSTHFLCTHRHPLDISDAVEHIDDFMSGRLMLGQ